MEQVESKNDEHIDASPLKSFFVSMLTRDVGLEDAILDLLDNCVDGILRSLRSNGVDEEKPYRGFKAEIKIEKRSFSISDNCGGIPWNLHDYAFRMGRSPGQESVAGSVGVYGIGMKRAIFKMGEHCLIKTQNGKHRYEIEILPEWLQEEENWDLPVRATEWFGDKDGTTIEIRGLYEGIAKKFEDIENFESSLESVISTHYAYIFEKGFEVAINGRIVKPRTTRIVFDEEIEKTGIRPYVFETTLDDVKVFLTVGFWRPIPSQNEMDDEKESTGYSSIDAGWTILCNDRAVVFCDRSELTGWGEANVPRYHNQFIAISGIVEFKSDDPSKLPTTTTKRGLDASSPLYLQIKNRMREGMKIFTDYTNKWKGKEDESKKQIKKGEPLSLNEIKTESHHLDFITIKKSYPHGKQYKPTLPLPSVIKPSEQRISFLVEKSKIRTVAEYFGNPHMEPSEVAKKCFDMIYEEAKK